MELIDILGYFGALLIGLVLGLIGGGGSILTVPILVYVLGEHPETATAYSLFVVGASAAVGAIRNAQKKMVDFRTGIVFAIPALITVYLTRKFLVPAIPDEIISTESLTVSKDMAIMVFFAVIMLLASISMIRGRKDQHLEAEHAEYNYPMIILEGIVVGVVTGLIGAGGGFLIIPALVMLAKIPMKRAVATSLMIIAVKSLIGFIGDVENIPIEWGFLLSFTGISIIGIFIGIYLTKFIDGAKLKKGFGWFVLIMGVYIIVKETVFKKEDLTEGVLIEAQAKECEGYMMKTFHHDKTKMMYVPELADSLVKRIGDTVYFRYEKLGADLKCNEDEAIKITEVELETPKKSSH